MSTKSSVVYNGIHAWRDVLEDDDLVFFDSHPLPWGAEEDEACLTTAQMDLLASGWIRHRKGGESIASNLNRAAYEEGWESAIRYAAEWLRGQRQLGDFESYFDFLALKDHHIPGFAPASHPAAARQVHDEAHDGDEPEHAGGRVAVVVPPEPGASAATGEEQNDKQDEQDVHGSTSLSGRNVVTDGEAA